MDNLQTQTTADLWAMSRYLILKYEKNELKTRGEVAENTRRRGEIYKELSRREESLFTQKEGV